MGAFRSVRSFRSTADRASNIAWLKEGTLTIITSRNVSRGVAAAALAVGSWAAFAPAAHAELATLTVNGIFNGTAAITDTITNGTGTGAPTLAANEPFTLTGVFNTSSPNLNQPLPPFLSAGWVDFAPLSVTLTVGGSTYSVATYQSSLFPTGGPGLTVAIFDDTTIFAPLPPPFTHFAAGFIQNPLADGAGIVGDWTDLSPGYTIPNLVTTTYPASDFYGVGFGSGPCPMGNIGGVCLPLSNPPPNEVVPIPLDGGAYFLTLGTYDLNNSSNVTDDPTHGPFPNPIDSPYFFSAQLTVVPEPSTWALLLVGFAGLAAAGIRVSRKAGFAV
jgi:PEP-CTERM motif